MSHIATIEIQIKDPEALAEACHDMGATITHNTEVTIYKTIVSGTAIQIPGWIYPVVLRGTELIYDNYNGQWGSIAQLKRLRQLYTTKATIRAARRMGRRVIAQEERNGRIRLTLG